MTDAPVEREESPFKVEDVVSKSRPTSGGKSRESSAAGNTARPRVRLPSSEAQQRRLSDAFIKSATNGGFQTHRSKAASVIELPDDEMKPMYRSKYSGLPGSIHAGRIDFEMDEPVYGKEHCSKRALEAKQEVFRMRQSRRLGVSREWNSSTDTGEPAIQRSMQRQLHAYQSEKLDINFRASEVPDMYKKTIFIHRSNKFEVDKEPFLNSTEKEKAVRHNVNARKEMIEFERQQRYGKHWNKSTLLTDEERQQMDMELTATVRSKRKKQTKKHLKNYVSPIQREIMKQEEIREQKRKMREEESHQAGTVTFSL